MAACEHCQTFKPSQHKEPLLTTLLPSRPWEKLGIDLCLYGGQNYLVMIDYNSRWIEVLHVRSTTTTAACVAKMKDVFARFGFPEEIVSDNGPQFASSEFRSFVESNRITHITSSPFLPNANGEAERAVQTAKRILRQRDPAVVGLDDIQRHGHFSHWAQPNSAVDRSTHQDESSDSIISPAVMSIEPGGHSRKRQQSQVVIRPTLRSSPRCTFATVAIARR